RHRVPDDVRRHEPLHPLPHGQRLPDRKLCSLAVLPRLLQLRVVLDVLMQRSESTVKQPRRSNAEVTVRGRPRNTTPWMHATRVGCFVLGALTLCCTAKERSFESAGGTGGHAGAGGTTMAGGSGPCTPGSHVDCYSGPPGTEGIAACVKGSRT